MSFNIFFIVTANPVFYYRTTCYTSVDIWISFQEGESFDDLDTYSSDKQVFLGKIENSAVL